MTLRQELILYHYKQLLKNKARQDSEEDQEKVTVGNLIAYSQPEELAKVMEEAICTAEHALDKGEELYEQWKRENTA